MIGIIGAMQEEVEQLVSCLAKEKETKVANMIFYTGKLCDKKVTIVRSGIGKVNAAVCTQILCDKFNVDTVINTGIAGSLDAKIDIADVVISTDVIHHDMDATGFGYKRGQVPRMEEFAFVADKKLVSICEKACENANLSIGVHLGRIVSGDQFVADKNKKDDIKDTFDGMCTEMEGAAIGHTATINNIPFVIIRTISDKADDSASIDYPTFEKKAIYNLVAITKEFCKLV